MALIPHKADPNYKQQMEEFEANPEQWGVGLLPPGVVANTAQQRTARRIVFHFGLQPAAEGHLTSIADRLLDAAKGDESKVNLESARVMLKEIKFL